MNKLTVLVGIVVTSQAIQAGAWGWERSNYSHGRDSGRGDDRHHGAYTRHYEPCGREVRSLDRDVMRLFVGGMEYYFWEGMYYRRMADRYVVVQAPIGAVVTTIPPEAQIMVVDGVPYYSVNGVTYVSSGFGYQVVPPPRVVLVQNAPAPQQTTIITPPREPIQSTATAVQAPPAPVQSTVSAAQTPGSDDSFTVNIPNAQGGYSGVVLKRSGNGFVGPQGEYYAEFPKVEQLKLMYSK